MASFSEENPSNQSGEKDPAEKKEFIRQMLLPDFVFPLQETDDNLTVDITETVSFGDIEDASRGEPETDIYTVRKFYPGKYKVTVIGVPTPCDESTRHDALVIFHHVDVNPNLVVQQVMRMSDDYYCSHGLDNDINRYDWLNYKTWISDEDLSGISDDSSNLEEKNESCSTCEHAKTDERCEICEREDKERKLDKANHHVLALLKEKFESVTPTAVPMPNLDSKSTLIYFTKTEEAKNLVKFMLRKQIRRSSSIRNLFSVQDDDGNTVSIGINFAPYNEDDYNYAKLFEDRGTGKYFALIVNGYLSFFDEPWVDLFNHDEKLELDLTTLDKTELKFPLNQFLSK